MGATLDGNVATAAVEQGNLIIQTPPTALGTTRQKILAVAAPGTSVTVPGSYATLTPAGAPANNVDVAGGMLFAAFSNDVATNECAQFDPVGFSAGDIINAEVLGGALILRINGAEVYRSSSAASLAGQCGALFYFA
jgi:hypothetical protein